MTVCRTGHHLQQGEEQLKAGEIILSSTIEAFETDIRALSWHEGAYESSAQCVRHLPSA